MRRTTMARARRGSTRRRSTATEDPATGGGTDDFLGQVGLFETANGLPHGPAAIALAILAAVLIYPITRLIGAIRRR
jgi:hypothetical protein